MNDIVRLPRIIRQTCIYTERESAASIRARIRAVKSEARALAKRLGYRKMTEAVIYDVHVGNQYLDYPAYLLGPKAPQIMTWCDALAHSPTGAAQFTIVIRDGIKLYD